MRFILIAIVIVIVAFRRRVAGSITIRDTRNHRQRFEDSVHNDKRHWKYIT